MNLTDIEIFDGRPGYRFVMPHVAISALDVREELMPGGMWRLTATDDGVTHVGESESRIGAYLALIADRAGLVATITSKPEADRD